MRVAFFFALVIIFLFSSERTWANTFEEGLQAYEEGKAMAAYEIWVPLAENGDVTAQYSLGKLFDRGLGALKADPVLAAHWYRAAAAEGSPQALNDLGLLYAQGRGVPEDIERAAALWQASAAKDYPWAQYNLALAYFRGQGVTENRTEAVSLFKQAAGSGLATAQYAMGQFSEEGHYLKKDQSEALRWYQLAADQGLADAQHAAGRLIAAGVTERMVTNDAATLVAESVETEIPEASTMQADEVALEEESIELGVAPEISATAVPDAETESVSDMPPEPALEPEPLISTEVVIEADQDIENNDESSAGAMLEAAVELPPVPSGKPESVLLAAAPSPEKPKSVLLVDVPGKSASREKEDTDTVTTATLAGSDGADAEDVSQTAASGDLFRLWLASASSEAEANALWQEGRLRYGSVMDDWPVLVKPHTLSGGTQLYRILAGGFTSQDDAKSACGALRGVDPETFCIVRGPTY